MTHDTRDALMVSDRVIYMSSGQLVQLGEVSKIYNQPINLEVASFFGRINHLKSITGEDVFIRAENCHIEENKANGVKMAVEACFNLGHVFLLKISHKSQFEYYLYSKRQYGTGQIVYVSYNKSCLWCF